MSLLKKDKQGQVPEEKPEAAFRTAERVLGILNLGKSRDPEHPSDAEVFVRFLKDYLTEIRKDR